VIEAAAKLPPWLPSREAVARVARHLGCTPEEAELQIVAKGRDGRVKARGLVEGQPVWATLADWHGTVDLPGFTMKPPEGSCEITNLELCFIDLIAAGLPAPTEKAWWPAEEAIAYLVKGVPLPWGAWQGASASPPEIEQAEIDLGEAILAGVPAQGRLGPLAPLQPIPADTFHSSMIKGKALPVSVARRPKVVVDLEGYVTTWPRQRSADYRGPPWQAIEVDSAALRKARPRPLTTQADPAPSSAPKKQSRKRAVRQAPQQKRARAVLDRMFPDGNYPTEGQISWFELRHRFNDEYARYEKDNPSKLYAKTKLTMPSVRTIRRALGWE
jgi:hypothetical protein